MIAIAIAALLSATPAMSDATSAPNRARLTPTTIAFDSKPSRKEIEAILKAPDSVEPMNYIYVVQELWRRGDREQAAFWFYVFQSRTRAWSKSDSTYAQARGALNSVQGQVINEWVGSDLDALLALAQRAIAYEKTFPFFDGRPRGAEPAKWDALVLTEREAYAAEFEEASAEMRAEKSGWAASRRENGLYVGPWKSRGKPLPEHWR